MAGGTQAADAANAQVNIIGHILDRKTLELPFVDPHHLLAGEVPLPSIELFGIDMSITRHIVMMWVASFLLVVLMVKAFRSRGTPSGTPTGRVAPGSLPADETEGAPDRHVSLALMD